MDLFSAPMTFCNSVLNPPLWHGAPNRRWPVPIKDSNTQNCQFIPHPRFEPLSLLLAVFVCAAVYTHNGSLWHQPANSYIGRSSLFQAWSTIALVKGGRGDLSIFGHNKRTIWGEFGLPIMCNFPAAPSPQRRTPRAVFQTPFVSNHPFSQINSEAHKVMLHLPSPLMTGATFKCKQLPFDSPDVTLV